MAKTVSFVVVKIKHPNHIHFSHCHIYWVNRFDSFSVIFHGPYNTSSTCLLSLVFSTFLKLLTATVAIKTNEKAPDWERARNKKRNRNPSNRMWWGHKFLTLLLFPTTFFPLATIRMFHMELSEKVAETIHWAKSLVESNKLIWSTIHFIEVYVVVRGEWKEWPLWEPQLCVSVENKVENSHKKNATRWNGCKHFSHNLIHTLYG